MDQMSIITLLNRIKQPSGWNSHFGVPSLLHNDKMKEIQLKAMFKLHRMGGKI